MSCTLDFGPDQRQILDAAAALLQEHFPISRLRRRQQDPLAEIAAFGGFALALPDAIGGTGFSLVEEVLLHILFGRHLVSTSALAAPIGARLASEIGHDDLARAASTGKADFCTAIRTGDSLLLVDAESKSHAVTWAGDRLMLIDLVGLATAPVTAIDRSLPLSRARLSEAKVIGESAGNALLRIADLLVSAQLLGIAEATRDLAVDYARVRKQFGRPIGSFQAVKHHCADMAIAAELLSAQLDFAAIAERDGRADAAFQTAALWLLAPRAALGNARTCIQIHGGIGFSAEADAHHYLKRAHLLRQFGGNVELLDLPAPLCPHERN